MKIKSIPKGSYIHYGTVVELVQECSLQHFSKGRQDGNKTKSQRKQYGKKAGTK